MFFALLIIFDFTATSCATMGNPSGGPKDSLAPVLDTAFPPNLTTNFTSKEVVLVFDEYLTLKSANKQIMMSPPIEGDLSIELKGREIIISWDDTLQENTTYTISFGNAVTDFTEGNPNDNLKYVFSTGDFIDSLSLEGRVINAKGEAVEDILVAMYDYARLDSVDSIPFDYLPSYYAYTDEAGKFEMSYLKYGNYHVVAFKDVAGNFKMSTGSELTGFLSDTLVLDTATKPILIQVFEPAPAKRMLNPRHVSYGKVQMPFNYSLEDFDLQVEYPTDTLPQLLTFSQKRDTAFFWFHPREGLDSLSLLISRGEAKMDTASVALREFELPELKLNPVQKELKFDEAGALRGNMPLASLQKEKLRIFAKDTTTADSFYLRSPLVAAFAAPSKTKGFSVQLLPGAVISFFGNTNDTAIFSYSVLSKEQLGSLLFSVIGDTGQAYLLIIKDPAGKEIIREAFVGEEVVNMRHYKPGAYSIELVVDENADGEWTTGNYLKGKQPERIIPYTEQAEIRENWELELDWIVQEQKAAPADTTATGAALQDSLSAPAVQDSVKESRSDKN